MAASLGRNVRKWQISHAHPYVWLFHRRREMTRAIVRRWQRSVTCRGAGDLGVEGCHERGVGQGDDRVGMRRTYRPAVHRSGADQGIPWLVCRGFYSTRFDIIHALTYRGATLWPVTIW